MATTLVDRVKIQVMSSGTGPFSLGPAVPGFRGVEALIDGRTYSYAVGEDSLYEVGTGVFISLSTSFIRTPQLSSNGGAAVAFPANVQLVFTALAADYAASSTADIVNGVSPWDLPDEADGDPIPPPGSRRPYLSGGVMKIA